MGRFYRNDVIAINRVVVLYSSLAIYIAHQKLGWCVLEQ